MASPVEVVGRCEGLEEAVVGWDVGPLAGRVGSQQAGTFLRTEVVVCCFGGWLSLALAVGWEQSWAGWAGRRSAIFRHLACPLPVAQYPYSLPSLSPREPCVHTVHTSRGVGPVG